MMKLKLLSPGRMVGYTNDTESGVPWFPKNSLPILAALTPGDWDIEIKEGVDFFSLNFDEKVDLVAMTSLTPFANDAYKIADAYREKGVKIILGGVHFSALPEEALQHADSVCIGEVENLWGRIIEDFKNGNLQKTYRSTELCDMDKIPLPRLDLLNQDEFAEIKIIEYSRGCPYKCGFCCTPFLFGNKHRFKSIDKVISEIKYLQTIQEGDFRIVDHSLGAPGPSKAFARAMEPLNLSWCAGTYIETLGDRDYLKILKKGGCTHIYYEAAAISRRSKPDAYERIRKILKLAEAEGIEFIGNWTVGYDDHDESVIDDTLRLIEEGGSTFHHAFIQLLVPWPGTKLYYDLEKQGRILTKDWSQWDNYHVVFEPKLVSPEKLHERYWQAFFESKKT
jgi:radical SAM superfamily enzyme YgiQ (UPF0313 family)